MEEQKVDERFRDDFGDDQIRKKLDSVLNWAAKDSNRWFCTDYIVSLDKQFRQKKSLSQKQRNALDNIIKKCVDRPSRPHWK